MAVQYDRWGRVLTESTSYEKEKIPRMYSIAFPDIFNKSTVKMYRDYDAINSNLKLLLGSNRGGLFGDPFFGVNLKQFLFGQNTSTVIKDILIDDICMAVNSYMPQVTVNREDVKIESINNLALVTIKVTDNINNTSNLYEIQLTASDEA